MDRRSAWRRRMVGAVLVAALNVCGLATAASSPVEVSVKAYGATGNGSTNDTAAIQRANDAVHAKGGGRVSFPPGTYIAAGIQQDSGVEFSGPRSAVLKHPNGVSPSSIVRSRRATTTGTIEAGSRALRVASSWKVRPGAAIAIRGAGVAGPSRYAYNRVAAVSGGWIMLEAPVTAAVSNAPVAVGATDIAIRGLTMDGNRSGAGSTEHNVVAVEYLLASRAAVTDTSIRRAEHGAVWFDLGTVDSTVERNVLMDNGAPEIGLGAAIWLFRGASWNVVRDNTIGGSAYRGIFLDDQTQTSTDWDAPPTGNVVENNQVDIAPVGWNSGIHLTGSSYNTVRNNVVRNVPLAIAVDQSMQGAGRDSASNVVSGNSLTNHHIAIQVTGSSNRFDGNQITNTTKPIVDKGSNNSFS